MKSRAIVSRYSILVKGKGFGDIVITPWRRIILIDNLNPGRYGPTCGKEDLNSKKVVRRQFFLPGRDSKALRETSSGYTRDLLCNLR
jgi:hypothetical protein